MSLEEDRKFFTNFKDEIRQTLLAIETYENAIIVGERGSGKTSFLNHIYHNLLENKRVLTVRFSTLKVIDINQVNFLTGIFNEVVSLSHKYFSNKVKLKNFLISMFEPSQKNLRDTEYEVPKDDFYVALDKFTSIIDYLKKDGVDICVILDDTDKIDSKLIWNIFRGIRDALWKLKIPIIITSLPNQVNEITKVPLDHFFPYLIKLKSFDLDSSHELIEKRLQYSDLNVKLNNEVMEEILRRTGGNPRDIIEIFKKLFEDIEIKDSITKKQLESLGLLFSKKLPNIERSVCNYLIHYPNTSASSPEFASSIGVTRSRLAQILNKLKKQGMIGSKKEGKTVTYFLTSYGKHYRNEEHKSSTNEIKILPGSSIPNQRRYLEPEILSINVGDKVIWKNTDTAAHTVTSGTQENGPNGTFDSALFMAGTNFEMIFDKKGTYPYFCMVHPWKTGKIIVK